MQVQAARGFQHGMTRNGDVGRLTAFRAATEFAGLAPWRASRRPLAQESGVVTIARCSGQHSWTHREVRRRSWEKSPQRRGAINQRTEQGHTGQTYGCTDSAQGLTSVAFVCGHTVSERVQKQRRGKRQEVPRRVNSRKEVRQPRTLDR